MRDLVVIGLVTGAALALSSCGPSLRLEEQSTAYFEHCHAAERDPRASIDERAACWEAWLAHWSGATDRSRVLHAKERVAALSQGGVVATRVEEPPPDDARRVPLVLDRVPPSPVVPRHSNSRLTGSTACDAVCLPAFERCIDDCDEGVSRDCRAACEAERRVCQLACP